MNDRERHTLNEMSGNTGDRIKAMPLRRLDKTVWCLVFLCGMVAGSTFNREELSKQILTHESKHVSGIEHTCTDTGETNMCEENYVRVHVTRGLVVKGVINNPASTEREDPKSPVVLENVKYTYGSLRDCSTGCHDIKGLDRDYDLVCVTCTNLHSCGRATKLHLNKTGKLDFFRRKNKDGNLVLADGPSCSCLFTPLYPLIAGICSSPYYISVTVL